MSVGSGYTDAVSLASQGLAGPWPLSARARRHLQPLVTEASFADIKRNLHVTSALARQVIFDSAIRERVVGLCGSGYKLWRTNFFQRQLGEPHTGVGWHHDKHFQDGDAALDFQEVGDHISIVIGLDQIDNRNGPFHYLPSSFQGEFAGNERDTRPYSQRPFAAHFLLLSPELYGQVVQITIPVGHFCLFHSALVHGSGPSEGKAARTSMVGRLVREHCLIPEDCASSKEVMVFC